MKLRFRVCLLLPALWGMALIGPAQSQELVIQPSASVTATFRRVEFSIAVSRSYTNPFDPAQVDLQIEVRQPGGKVIRVPAFWGSDYEHQVIAEGGRPRDWFYPKGPPGWRARFAPSLPGRHEVVAHLADPSGRLSSRPVVFDSVVSTNRGFVRVSSKDPRFLELSTGEAFFPIGQNLAFIGNQQYVSLSRAKDIFARLEENGANYLRIWACCQDWAMAIEARKSAWGRSWDWRPPLTDAPAQSQGRQALRLAAGKGPLKADPSHPVALKPNTTYHLTGQAFASNAAAFKILPGRNRPPQSFMASAGKWAPFKAVFSTGKADYWLGTIEFSADNQEPLFLQHISLQEEQGGPELLWEAEVNRPVLGFYNPVDCFMLDELVSSAERHGIYLQLCLLTRDLYMARLKDPNAPAYREAIADARRTFRYAVARWGYSPAIAAWEYWNEMDPKLPTDRFYTELGEYLETVDVNHHLRTTSAWGPSAKDCRHPKLDLADTHFYLRPADAGRLDDEVHAILDRTAWLRTQAPAKPAHLGEFGLADDKWGLLPRMRQSRELADFHNAMWASALSGASGSAMFWWWERLDQRDAYPVYRAVSRFIGDIPWTSGIVTNVAADCPEPRLRVIGLQNENRAWLWFHDRESVWNKLDAGSQPSPVKATAVQLRGFPDGQYQLEWVDTKTGESMGQGTAENRAGAMWLKMPSFERDIGCRVYPVK